MTSILQQARNEGYRDGLGQASQLAYDHAREQGRRLGYEEGAAHYRRWGGICFLSGIGVMAIVQAYFL